MGILRRFRSPALALDRWQSDDPRCARANHRVPRTNESRTGCKTGESGCISGRMTAPRQDSRSTAPPQSGPEWQSCDLSDGRQVVRFNWSTTTDVCNAPGLGTFIKDFPTRASTRRKGGKLADDRHLRPCCGHECPKEPSVSWGFGPPEQASSSHIWDRVAPPLSRAHR